MTHREYRAVPLPALKTRRNRNPSVQVAEIVQETINRMAEQGWTYLRAETVRAMESQGLLRGREEVAYTVLVFDRPAASAEPAEAFHDDVEESTQRPRERRPRASRLAPVASEGFDEPDFEAPRRSQERAQERPVERLADRVEPFRRTAAMARDARAEDGRRPAAARPERRLDLTPEDLTPDDMPARRRMRPARDDADSADDRIDVGRETPRRSESGFIARASRPDRQRR